MELQLKQLQRRLSNLPDSEWDLFSHYSNVIICARYPDSESKQTAIEQWIQAEHKPINGLQHLLFDSSLTQLIDDIVNDMNQETTDRPPMKSSELAMKSRELGNILFLSGNYLQALQAYNRSLLLAPHPKTNTSNNLLQVPGKPSHQTGKPDCAELALAFGNRSAVLYQLGDYEHSLEDIRLALSNGYPAQKEHVLYGRRILCLRALARPEAIIQRAMSDALQQLRRRHQPEIQWQQVQRYLQICLERLPLDPNNFHQSQLEQEDGRLSPLPWRPWDENGKKLSLALPSTPFVSPLPSPLSSPRTSPNASPEQSEDEDSIPEKFKKKHAITPSKAKKSLISGKIEKCVEISYDQERGRHLIATKDISVGQLVLSEPPFVGWLRPSRYLSNCFECHLPLLPQRFVPCRQCDIIRYCSRTCSEKNWNQVHQIECKWLNILGLLSIGHLALRTLWVGGISHALNFFDISKSNNYKPSISSNMPEPPSNKNDSSKAKSKENSGKKKDKMFKNKKSVEVKDSIAPINLSTNSTSSSREKTTNEIFQAENRIPLFNHSEYELVLHLATNFHHLQPQLTFNHAVGAIFLARLCQKVGLGGPAYRKTALLPLSVVLLYHILQIRCNAKASEAPTHLLPDEEEYEVTSLDEIKEAAQVAVKHQSKNEKSISSDVKQKFTRWTEAQLHAAINSQMIGERTGFGVQLFTRLSLVNHGCAANSYTKKIQANVNGTVELLELRTAQSLCKGEEILFNYGCTWQQMSVYDRREWLLGQYGFECKCLACKENWQNWPQALRCDCCGTQGGAAVVINSGSCLANCVRCKWTLNEQQLEERLQKVDALRRRVELLVQQDDQFRTPEQGSLLYTSEKTDPLMWHPQLANEKNEKKQKNFEKQLNECLLQAEQLLFRDHDLLVDLHELAARSAERCADLRRACRFWIAVFASSCLNQGQASYDVLLSVLELSRLLCSLATNEHEQARQCQLQSDQIALEIEQLENPIEIKASNKPLHTSKSNRHSTKSKANAKEETKAKHQKRQRLEEQLEQFNKRQNECQAAAESARKAANGYFDKALLISKCLQHNEHQLLLSNANCVQRCVNLLTQLSPLFGNNVSD